VTVEQAVLHGHAMRYRTAGQDGPVLVLIHGITSSSRTWEPVIDALARDHVVVAPDLVGHGESAKPQGDYSLGAYASGVRDLLALLGHDRVTVVGHSLGGGVAMQFAYQFPEWLERLVLVSSGGLGREVSVLLRSASLPGAELVIPLLTTPPLRRAGALVGRVATATGLRTADDVEEMAGGVASLGDFEARRAFVHTVRGIIGLRGQRVSARDRLYLSADVPSLIVWGERDPIMPVAHGRAAQREMPGSRLEVFAGAGHFPYRADPERFAAVLRDFVASTEPAELEIEMLRARLREGRPQAATATGGAVRSSSSSRR
jgi:pimeloyl-ACP methyl ester carboxylesterase